MIKEMKALSLIEAKKLAEENNGKEELNEFFKKFINIDQKKADSLRKDLEALDNHKIKSDQIAKIIDFLPSDASDVNKIFTEVTLDENEIKQITSIVGKYN